MIILRIYSQGRLKQMAERLTISIAQDVADKIDKQMEIEKRSNRSDFLEQMIREALTKRYVKAQLQKNGLKPKKGGGCG